MQCQATTKSRTQCSRKAEPNSNYCWQHQNYIPNLSKKVENRNLEFKVVETKNVSNQEQQLRLNALQPNIMSNIISYSGTLGNFSKIFSETNQRKILKKWFGEIHIQTPFSEVKESEIPLLWGLYQNRIANAPPKDLLEEAIERGLSRDYFYAKVIRVGASSLTYGLNYEDLKDTTLLQKINLELQDTIKQNKLRYGDILVLGAGDGYYPIIFIYNGTDLILADFEYIDIQTPIIPSQILINNFPTTNYFTKVAYHIIYFDTNIVYFDTNGTDLKLLNQYKVSENYSIYHYITTGISADYEIWTYTPLTENNWKGVLPFDGAKAGWDLGEDFIEFIQNLISDEEIGNLIYDKITTNQNLRVLFQQELYNYS